MTGLLLSVALPSPEYARNVRAIDSEVCDVLQQEPVVSECQSRNQGAREPKLNLRSGRGAGPGGSCRLDDAGSN